MDVPPRERWIKNFGTKTDVVTILGCSKGNFRAAQKILGIPALPHHLYIDGEEYRLQEDLAIVHQDVAADILGKGRIIINEVRKAADALLEKSVAIAKAISNVPEDVTKETLWQYYQDFVESYHQCLAICDYPIFVEDYYAEQLREMVDSDEDFSRLTMYQEDSEAGKEKKAILEIVRERKMDRLSDEELRQKTVKLVERFSWLGTSVFFGQPKSVGEYRKEIMLVSHPEEKIKELEVQREKKEELFAVSLQKYGQNVRELAEVIQELIQVRDYRYKQIWTSALVIRPLLEKIGEKMGLSYLSVVHLTPEELLNFPGMPQLKRMAEERVEGFALLFNNGQFEIKSGAELERFKAHFLAVGNRNVLKGITACPGFATGWVKLVREAKDVSAFEKGQILVASMTTMNFLPAMEKAAAIITDIGGITCHAAILSRELGVPCVIGTKIATEVLKDGVMVEVDADKGIVRKLS